MAALLDAHGIAISCMLSETLRMSDRNGDRMSTVEARVGPGGRVTIPKSVRDQLRIRPGTKMEFRQASDGRWTVLLTDTNGQVIQLTEERQPKRRLAELLGHAGPGPTTDEIMALTRGDE
jgi:antitoxin PrlF